MPIFSNNPVQPLKKLPEATPATSTLVTGVVHLLELAKIDYMLMNCISFSLLNKHSQTTSLRMHTLL